MPEIEDLILILIVGAMVIAFFRSLLESDAIVDMNNHPISPFIAQQQQQKVSSNYNPTLIQRVAFQVMETLYIMNTSKAVDTIIGRYPFLMQSINLLKLAKNNIRYNSDIQYAIDDYKTVYYDRIPDDFQLASLVNPTRFDVAFFYCSCLFSGLRKHINEIDLVQTDQVKQNHIDKIINLIQLVRKELIEKCNTLQNLQVLIEQLNDTEQGYRNL